MSDLVKISLTKQENHFPIKILEIEIVSPYFVLALDLFQGCGQNFSTDGLILIESGGLMVLELIKNGLNPLVQNWLS